MNIDWLHILVTILLIVAGYFIAYFKKRADLVAIAEGAINTAERAYADITKAGSKKLEFATDLVYGLVPMVLKPLITRDMVTKLIQDSFDLMAKYADQQLDKLLNKSNEIEG